MQQVLPRALVYIALYVLAVHGWSLTVEQQPETCIGLSLAFSGGTPPYTITLLHMPDVSETQLGNLSSWASGASEMFTFNQAYPASAGMGVGTNNVGFTPMVIIGSDATGFGTGGTSQAFTVLPEVPPLLPGCSIYPTNDTGYLSYLHSFSTSITECGTVTAQLNASFPGGINIDTIVPLGQSYRTFVNVSATNGAVSLPVKVSTGTNVSFAFSDPTKLDKLLFVTPLITVQPGNTSCQATGTISAPPTALPTDGQVQSTSAAMHTAVSGGLLLTGLTVVSLASGVMLLRV